MLADTAATSRLRCEDGSGECTALAVYEGACAPRTVCDTKCKSDSLTPAHQRLGRAGSHEAAFASCADEDEVPSFQCRRLYNVLKDQHKCIINGLVRTTLPSRFYVDNEYDTSDGWIDDSKSYDIPLGAPVQLVGSEALAAYMGAYVRPGNETSNYRHHQLLVFDQISKVAGDVWGAFRTGAFLPIPLMPAVDGNWAIAFDLPKPIAYLNGLRGVAACSGRPEDLGMAKEKFSPAVWNSQWTYLVMDMADEQNPTRTKPQFRLFPHRCLAGLVAPAQPGNLESLMLPTGFTVRQQKQLEDRQRKRIQPQPFVPPPPILRRMSFKRKLLPEELASVSQKKRQCDEESRKFVFKRIQSKRAAATDELEYLARKRAPES
mmetsp:Transcript_9329/g.16852  ORF Transcript_9329/g.16852 Transcript_9329/m.16852 type:complete len:376 (-) Transcript_9329:182-1309(-)